MNFKKLQVLPPVVAEPEPPGTATFRVWPEPIFLLAGAESRSRLFKAALAASKKESLVLTKHDLKQFMTINLIQKSSVAKPKLFIFGSGSDYNFGSSYSHILAL